MYRYAPFSLGRKRSYPLWFAFALLFAGSGFYLLAPIRQTPELLLSLFGGISAFFHFLYSQHNTSTDRFVGLFKEFNARYDRLNDDLNRIYSNLGGAITDPIDRQRLYDYFNLCAEEYLYFKSGYIDQEVWVSWLRGMDYFSRNKDIKAIWERELENGSYYGFKLSLLKSEDYPNSSRNSPGANADS